MPMAIASFSNLSFAISTVRFLMCGGACSRVMKTEPSLMSSTVASTIWSVSSTGSLRVHIRRSLHQDARTRRGREADAPTVPGRGRGGAYHTRVPLLIGMLKLSACAGCRRTRCYLGKALAAIAVSRGGVSSKPIEILIQFEILVQKVASCRSPTSRTVCRCAAAGL